MHVVATAGHVDHGKSTLVRALTGMEPDRWAEERRRGLTIDLGFAWTALPSGARVAFVDVPGHERFVGNMLAGVGPAPAVMFVVAADQGWRPQSAEHLAVLDAFGVQHGLLVVTRSDLADPGPARAQALARLSPTTLGAVDSVCVSGTTGAGLDQLRLALDRLVASLPAPDRQAPVRLWADRAFTIHGAGTVITGTLGAGTIQVGDDLILSPDGRRVRIRGLQTLHAPCETVAAVARVAVNIAHVPVHDVGDRCDQPNVVVITEFRCQSLLRMAIIRRMHRIMRLRVREQVDGFLDAKLYYDWPHRTLRSVSLWSDGQSIYGMGNVGEHVRASRIPGRLGIETSCGVYQLAGDWRDVLFGRYSNGRPPFKTPFGASD